MAASKPHGRATVAVPLLVFLIAVAVRLPGLDRYVTGDEIFWLGRSANFYQALAHRDWANTYQFSHPGVTVTWLGTLAFLWTDPGYGFEVRQQFGADPDYPGQRPTVEVPRELRARGIDPLDLYVAMRITLVIAFGAILVALFLTLSRLVGRSAAAIAALLIACDPFTLALSRVVHVDALAAALLLLALALSLVFLLRGQRTTDLVLAGIVAALSCLTRISGLILVPVVVLLLAASLVARWRAQGLTRQGILAALRSMAIWSAAAAITFIVLWPAMWVQPVQTLLWTLTVSQQVAGEAHANPIFFAGTVTATDPGASFYVINLLWRTTPVVLIGLVFATTFAFIPALRARVRPVEGRTLLAILLLALIYFAVITAEPKKFDRYVLPVLLPLMVVAAWGWWAAARGVAGDLLHSAWARWAVPAAAALSLLPVAGQLASALPAFPYYFSAYNPMLGGASQAVHVMMIGRGEGYDVLAAQALALPNGPPGLLLTGDSTKMLDFYPGQVERFLLTTYLPGRAGPPSVAQLNDLALSWASADVFAVYIDQRQRQTLLSGVDAVLAQQPLLSTVTLNGLDYAWLYDIRDAPLPEVFYGETSPGVRWGDALLLLGVRLPDNGEAHPPHVLRAVLARPAGADAETDDLEIVAQVVNKTGKVVTSTATALPTSLPNVPTLFELRIELPREIPEKGVVQLALRKSRSETWLTSRRVADGGDLGPSVIIADLTATESDLDFAFRAPEAGVAPGVIRGKDRWRRERPEQESTEREGKPLATADEQKGKRSEQQPERPKERYTSHETGCSHADASVRKPHARMHASLRTYHGCGVPANVRTRRATL